MATTKRSAKKIKAGPTKDEIGDTPADFIAVAARVTSSSARHVQFESVMNTSRLAMTAFMELRDKDDGRLPVPVLDKKRIKLSTKISGDKDFYNATYLSLNNEDYIIAQGPHKDNVGQMWRMVYQDGCQLVVCTVDEKSFSDSDRAKVFNFFPSGEGKSVQFLGSRYTVKCNKKQDQKGFVIYDLTLTSTDQYERNEEAEKEGDDKTRSITLIHVYDWKNDQWPNLDMLATVLKATWEAEQKIVKNVSDEYIPPVVFVGHHGVNRSCAMWVMLMTSKQCERRDSFDIDQIMKQLVRVRPGAFNDRATFFVTYAMAFKLAMSSGWMTSEEGKQRVSDIQDGYKKLAK
ncbi:unnamed protein product [Bursaphelenchus okinawaensis]|uniref:Tyrosine-protein phosphatase domain-containing protein n=1 Tax=Bursaphelenchus okinawaensis TaxID=465554 RepID=A0A811LP75_9BILA|nr:unnamed protein product [Bursaphelenchus okinawaensis]CAG9127495.1 unnamed protein product [Bursaphelenchus okinawaensis]